MNSKIIFAALAITFTTGIAAHADEYRRPQRPVQQPQQQEKQPFDDENLDQEYQRPSRDCDRCQVEQQRPRQEYYCQQPHCRPPEVLPYPQAPVYVPVPVPQPIQGGVCVSQPRNFGGVWGWAIVLNGQVEVARGTRADARNLLFIKQQLQASGICSYFPN